MKVIDNILPADPNKKVKFLNKTLFEQRILKDLRDGKKLVIASNNKHWINEELVPLIEEMQKEDPALLPEKFLNRGVELEFKEAVRKWLNKAFAAFDA